MTTSIPKRRCTAVADDANVRLRRFTETFLECGGAPPFSRIIQTAFANAKSLRPVSAALEAGFTSEAHVFKHGAMW